MRIVRQSQFKASPWKNGGGITHEAMRVPERGAFRWRVSIAHIDMRARWFCYAVRASH
jgi:environmental stress-induced protein Ves